MVKACAVIVSVLEGYSLVSCGRVVPRRGIAALAPEAISSKDAV
jgi:hypothetical protein